MWYIYFFPLQPIPLTPTKGKSFSRVYKSLPLPLPLLTLPITPRGFKTPGNPYSVPVLQRGHHLLKPKRKLPMPYELYEHTSSIANDIAYMLFTVVNPA